MDTYTRIVSEALALFDGLIYLDKKQIVRTAEARLHPSETHMLTCAVSGMSFSEIAQRFGVSKAAVSRTFARLSSKGLVSVSKDPTRKNRASVTLTPAGQAVFEQAESLRQNLSAALERRLVAYTTAELETIECFLHDLDDYVRDSFHTIPNAG
jgi:DNA-binding MarR family transcriptional regulator